MSTNETIRLAMPGGDITIPPPPCGWCAHAKTCEEERKACGVFYAYISGRSRVAGKKKPSAAWGDVIFSTDDDGRALQMLINRALMDDRGHPTDLDAIYAAHESGESMRSIAQRHNVSLDRIIRIVRARNADQA